MGNGFSTRDFDIFLIYWGFSTASLEGTMNPYEEIERRASSAKSLQESAEVLEILLSGGFSVWTDGSLYNIKQLVARVNGLRIEAKHFNKCWQSMGCKAQ